MSEIINNVSRRKEMLKNVLKQLQAGQSLESVKDQFGSLVSEISSVEIAEIEQLMIEEGTPPEEIQRLCDVHVAFFKEHLDMQEHPETIPGHPLFTMRSENQLVERDLNRLRSVWEQFVNNPSQDLKSQVLKVLTEIKKFEVHYRRKENILFSMLEKKGFSGPSTVMWGIQDEIRAALNAFERDLEKDKLESATILFEKIQTEMREMIYKEEKILFPASLERVSEEEWMKIYQQEGEMGFYQVTPAKRWAEEVRKQNSPIIPLPQPLGQPQNGILPMQTGGLTLEQINLMMTHLPIDVTFVDENDEVRFFSQTRERIFERLPAIIGRKVQNCHPPQSVHIVQHILDDFQAGIKNEAEFWIEMGGMFVHIRYFAMRDTQGTYRGTIEVTQDVKAIRALEGEKRLLNW